MNTTEESKPMLISASRKQAGLPRANRTELHNWATINLTTALWLLTWQATNRSARSVKRGTPRTQSNTASLLQMQRNKASARHSQACLQAPTSAASATLAKAQHAKRVSHWQVTALACQQSPTATRRTARASASTAITGISSTRIQTCVRVQLSTVRTIAREIVWIAKKITLKSLTTFAVLQSKTAKCRLIPARQGVCKSAMRGTLKITIRFALTKSTIAPIKRTTAIVINVQADT